MPASERYQREIGGRTLSLSNASKVLYPETGFTKADVLDYYLAVAPVMLPHLADRCVTMRRFPNGVDGKSFFEKRCPQHRPEWLAVARGPGEVSGDIDYCVIDDVAGLAWAANLAAVELHTPMERASDPTRPTMVVFDLDPGAPAAMAECAQVALLIADALAPLGLELLAKTSGSKGLQLYLPLNVPHDPELVRSFALATASLLARHWPDQVVSDMAKAKRGGKVLIDWSQNSGFKTTVCAYSLRARPTPTVSTPVSWAEVAAAAEGARLSFTAPEVVARVAEHGDLFAAAATLEQQLPG